MIDNQDMVCKVVDGKHVVPCKRLWETGEASTPAGKRKGVFAWVYTDTKTGQKSRTMFGVKSGNHTEKGLLFNFCPFCGTRIDAPFNN